MRALIAMSGGVDSSVAALLMKENGSECTGCIMKLYNNEDPADASRPCGNTKDIEDANAVAEKLGIPFYVFDYTKEFETEIIGRFVDCYLKGITPNPCIDCNRYMKFGKLHEKAKELGMDCVVTGHYARVEKAENGKYVLRKALDSSKDQSYVLYSLTQEQLSHSRFPLGEMSKADARRIAEENGLVNADKPDSQDICFVPDGDYAGLIEKRTGIKAEPGKFIMKDGTVLGRHKGIIHYTVGQRRGLGVPGPYSYYVLDINTNDNTVTLGEKKDLFSDTVLVRDVNWISGETPREPFDCKVKIRYRHPEQPATVYPQDDGTVKIVFTEPQRAVTPGQSAVMYNGDIVLGGGIILK